VIILDTNLVSEPTKPAAHPSVIAWLDQQPVETLYLTSISLGELLTGVEILPSAECRQTLADDLHRLIDRLFGARILPFDEQAAKAYAPLVARARSKGSLVCIADAQIAAIAHASLFTVATRDQAPFQAMGIDTVNPWVD